jgi:hypothetical protein
MTAMCHHNAAMAARGRNSSSPFETTSGAWDIFLSQSAIDKVLAEAERLRLMGRGWDGYPLCEGNTAEQMQHTVLLPRMEVLKSVEHCPQLGDMLLQLASEMPMDVCLSQVQFLWQDNKAGSCVIFKYHTDSPQESNDPDRGSGKILLTAVTLLSGREPPHLRIAGKEHVGQYTVPGHTLVFCADCVHKTEVRSSQGRDHFAVKMVASWEHVQLDNTYMLATAPGALAEPGALSHTEQLLGSCMAMQRVEPKLCLRMGTELISMFDKCFVHSVAATATRYTLRCTGVALAVLSTMVSTENNRGKADALTWQELEGKCKALREALRDAAQSEGQKGVQKLYGSTTHGSLGRMKKDVYKLLDLLICNACGVSAWFRRGECTVQGMVTCISSRMQALSQQRAIGNVYGLVQAFFDEQIIAALPEVVPPLRIPAVHTREADEQYVPREDFKTVWQAVREQHQDSRGRAKSTSQPAPKRSRRNPVVDGASGEDVCLALPATRPPKPSLAKRSRSNPTEDGSSQEDVRLVQQPAPATHSPNRSHMEQLSVSTSMNTSTAAGCSWV